MAKGAPKGGAKGQAAAKSELAKQEERLAQLQAMYAGDADKPEALQTLLEQQKRIVDQVRQEEENKRSPAEKAAALRKELGLANDSLAAAVIKDQNLRDQMRALEEQQEINREEAYTFNERANELRERIREEELKCDLKCKKVPGEQVDMSAEAKVQRALATALSTMQSCFDEQALGVEEAQLAPIREQMGLVWGQVCALLSSKKPVPAEDAESDMQDVDEQQKPSKTQKKERSEEELAARAAAMLRGDSINEEDEGEEPTAEAWKLVVSKRHRKDYEHFCRQIQCLQHEDVAQKVQQLHNKAQGAGQARPRGKGKGGSTGSPTEQAQPCPGTPMASAWDSSTSYRTPQTSADFPPLQAKGTSRSAGTPPQPGATGSLTVQPMVVDSVPNTAETASRSPPASGHETLSPSGPPLPAAPSSGSADAPPAQGQENGRGGGSAA
jgi:hypothetical protein